MKSKMFWSVITNLFRPTVISKTIRRVILRLYRTMIGKLSATYPRPFFHVITVRLPPLK